MQNANSNITSRNNMYLPTGIHLSTFKNNNNIIIIFINCNWVITRWQWLYYMYTNMERKK